jgi:hypothetical protein
MPRYIMVYQCGRGVPDPVFADDSYLAVARFVLMFPPTQPTGMNSTVENNRMLAKFKQRILKLLGCWSNRVGLAFIKPANVQDFQPTRR